MNRLASPAQLRASLIRWTLFLVPLIVLLGFVSGMVAGSSDDNPWFATLVKPAIYPPPAAFGIVWTVLYVLMGLAFAGICSAWGSRWRPLAILAFLAQFAINLAWAPVFFAAEQIAAGFFIILALAVMVVVTMILFFRVRRWAGWLLAPYLAWVLFAAALNWQFWVLNPAVGGEAQSGAVQRIEM